ncbi:pilus assembly protein CpaE [Epibacterium ulvae]|uniref:Pilus assembly protein CpaE n=1 Tax=Epibacterium ulvae TaxID=1156985 RepID=A0A1G5R3W2_9RHOB|nr:AAA family ATPase [Epibacterium ulvae]SCZ68646.1 pilus assembly protein CpaE [Epibacterium ulvae]
MSSDQPQTETNAITACTISRDVQNFDLLIEDMETALGEAWGDLSFSEALAFFQQDEAKSLEFVAIALDAQDEDNLSQMGEIITQAKAVGIKIILIAEDVTPAVLHNLLRQGADEFIPYPLPEQELQAAIDRLRIQGSEMAAPQPATLKSDNNCDGAVVVCHGLAGGVGTTTLAVNLAWEIAERTSGDRPRVCLIDLDLQHGSVATYLDLPRREAVAELLSETESLDDDLFAQALVTYQDKLQVFTAPSEMLPMEFVGPEDVQRLINMARCHFDFVVIDLPRTLVQWSETVLSMAHLYFAVLELDMRSAQNALRLKRALQSEDLPFEKLRFALNRAPKFTDLSGKSRVKRLAESLGISIDIQLPDGGKTILQSCDHGQPLAAAAPKSALRKEIGKLAQSLHELGKNETEAA